MPCSPVTLSIATIAAVISVALLSIAFSTDNWVRISVDRNALQLNLTQMRNRATQRGETLDPELEKLEADNNILAFTRTKGLFRICFPEQRPKGADLYRSPVETYCKNIDYYLSGESTGHFSENTMSWLHMGRSMIAMFIIAFFFNFIAFWTGVAGCWRRSPGNITATALLMLLSCLFSAGGMGLWHGVEFFEREKLTDPEFYKQWPEILKENSWTGYDWSYILAWIGIGFGVLSTITFSMSIYLIKRDNRKELTAHIAGVYPQKQQYAYGYAYPGPYYPGTQPYPPYNY
ncbi:uncharacterized protein LOC136042158 isoform X2 [Artemia franciscana]|uniref:Uncharacterized protein n=1 Tax=Artemia franciscana TaxID=6661 RepID=A0AA88H6P3_ARTSF|nr:hypothetical protein QYM36_018392 [Artemia franciscana]